MTVITHSSEIDCEQTAKKIKLWLESEGFEVRPSASDGSVSLRARKVGAIRSAAGANRAINITLENCLGEAFIKVSRVPWSNILGATFWAVFSGGITLLATSSDIHRKLEDQIRIILKETE